MDNLGRDRDGDWRLFVTECANCERFIVKLQQYEVHALTDLTSVPFPGDLKRERMVWPRAVSRARIPAMMVTYPSNDCPRIMFRGRTSGRNQGNPSVYVDGTRMQDTCILSQINVADVDRVEVLPSGDTSRAGIQRNPAGLILVFRLR